MNRGRLRIYLGAAPGVGKTYAALDEARRLVAAGVDLVVGLVETHGRAETTALVEGLEIVPRRLLQHRGASFEEMDLDAILARAPQVVFIDELAHTNVPGSQNPKRWQDVGNLLDAGIDVISTVNIQHLESLNDVVAEITGVVQQETIPDDVVRRADEIELVDLTQEGIRDRLTAGKIYPEERVNAAMANFFRAGNLGALRELALSWTADRVDEALLKYREAHGIAAPWETRERVIVGVTGTDGGDEIIRRAARMAMRSRGILTGVHVRALDGLATGAAPDLESQKELLAQLGGEYVEMSGSDVASAIVEFARSENATQLVVGATRRNRWQRLVRGSVIEDVIRSAGPIDVHVISYGRELSTARPISQHPPALPRRRRWAGWMVGVGGIGLVTPLMLLERGDLALQNVLLVYLLVATAAAWTGGLGPALGAGLAGFLAGNYLFTPPFETWTIDSGQDVFALVAFLVVTGATGALVSLTARRAAQARRAHAEAETLLALTTVSGAATAHEILTRLQVALDLSGVLLFLHNDDKPTEITVGQPLPPDSSTRTLTLPGGGRLSFTSRPLSSDDERVLHAFVSQLNAAIDRDRLAEEAAEAQTLGKADELRTALLRAVSHDLRSPLASIKATVSSLLQEDITWNPEQIRDFLASTYTETLRLDHMVADLLDASRLQAGVVRPKTVRVGLDECVAAALVGVHDDQAMVELRVPENLPPVLTDPALLERVVENLIRNAIQYTPSGETVRVDAGLVGDSRIDLRIIDHGPGIRPEQHQDLFQPFQRMNGRTEHGVGLGLSVARGICNALGHELTAEDTPGGGATMVISFGTDQP